MGGGGWVGGGVGGGQKFLLNRLQAVGTHGYNIRASGPTVAQSSPAVQPSVRIPVCKLLPPPPAAAPKWAYWGANRRPHGCTPAALPPGHCLTCGVGPRCWLGPHLPLTKNPNCVYLSDCLPDCLPAGSETDWLTVNLSSRCTAEGNRISENSNRIRKNPKISKNCKQFQKHRGAGAHGHRSGDVFSPLFWDFIVCFIFIPKQFQKLRQKLKNFNIFEKKKKNSKTIHRHRAQGHRSGDVFPPLFRRGTLGARRPALAPTCAGAEGHRGNDPPPPRSPSLSADGPSPTPDGTPKAPGAGSLPASIIESVISSGDREEGPGRRGPDGASPWPMEDHGGGLMFADG